MEYYIGISKKGDNYENVFYEPAENKEEFIKKVSNQIAWDIYYNKTDEAYAFAIRFVDLSEEDIDDFANNFSATDLADTSSVYFMTIDYFFDHGDNCNIGYDYITADDISTIAGLYTVTNPFLTIEDIVGDEKLLTEAVYAYIGNRLAGDKSFQL